MSALPSLLIVKIFQIAWTNNRKYATSKNNIYKLNMYRKFSSICKFKAFDNRTQEWYYPAYISYGGIIDVKFGGGYYDNIGNMSPHFKEYNDGDVSLYAFTGFTDASGNDIYEGDVLRYIGGDQIKECKLAAVTYDFARGCFVFGEGISEESKEGGMPLYLINKECEVIDRLKT